MTVDTASARPDETVERGVPGYRPGCGRHWTESDYAPFVTGGGAAKLAASAVAPLVAIARGSESLTFTDAAATKAVCKRLGIDQRRSQGKRFVGELQDGDILVMPWYLPDSVARSQSSESTLHVTSMQYRPSRPAVHEATGKELKYEFVLGDETILGAHPCTPGAWFDEVDVPLLIAEGQLKADSAVTGSLIDAGVTPDQLRLAEDETVESARTRLLDLIAGVPEDSRLAVVAIAGVWNFRRNPEWTMLRLPERDVWIAVDGDVASNWRVWDATSQLFDLLDRRKARTRLLAPSVAVHGGDAKVGVDDFLADYGTWSDLLGQLAPSLPPQPSRQDADKIGEVRVSDDGTRVLECRKRVDPDTGETIGGEWVPIFPMGGRVLAVTTRRDPTDEEVETGVFGAGVDLGRMVHKESVEIEISWLDEDGHPASAVIEGPTTILGQPPDRWERATGVVIPAAVLRHPDWPPEGPVGRDWRRAVKANRHAETDIRTMWTRMGWVPVRSGLPVFSVGAQVIGEEVDGATQSAVSGLIPAASRFGVGEDDGSDWTDPEYRARLADDLRATIDTYLAAFTDRAAAAVALSAGVRPALPLRPRTTVYLVGAPGSGKSFTAGAICGFWAAKPGDWDGNALPGSAKDSVARTEQNLAATHIWVVDDLAPSADARRAATDQDAIGQLVRSVHNGTGRGRMNQDGIPRPDRAPRALLVATAENESPIASVRQRSVTVRFRKGSLPASRQPTNALNVLYQHDGAPARVTQGLIKMIRHRARHAHHGSWRKQVAEAEATLGDARALVERLMGKAGHEAGSTERSIALGGDLVVALSYLGQMADELGLDPSYSDLLDGFDGLPRDLIRLIVSEWEEHSETTPGQSLLAAISSLLRSGRAHVTCAASPTAAPGDGDAQIASALGWVLRGNDLQPGGPAIGVYGTLQDTGEAIVLMDRTNAFDQAHRAYPDLLPPGSRPSTSWQSAKDEGLLMTALLAPDAGSPTIRRRLGADSKRFSGVPIELARLIGGGSARAGALSADHDEDLSGS